MSGGTRLEVPSRDGCPRVADLHHKRHGKHRDPRTERVAPTQQCTSQFQYPTRGDSKPHCLIITITVTHADPYSKGTTIHMVRHDQSLDSICNHLLDSIRNNLLSSIRNTTQKRYLTQNDCRSATFPEGTLSLALPGAGRPLDGNSLRRT